MRKFLKCRAALTSEPESRITRPGLAYLREGPSIERSSGVTRSLWEVLADRRSFAAPAALALPQLRLAESGADAADHSGSGARGQADRDPAALNGSPARLGPAGQ
jgi:hypothetical protein